MFLKKKLVNKRSLNVIVKCPEESKLDIIKNSCHIISILLFIFGKLKLKRKIISKNFINNHLVGKNGLNINIFFSIKLFLIEPIVIHLPSTYFAYFFE